LENDLLSNVKCKPLSKQKITYKLFHRFCINFYK
jgi:hypothetical protein